MDAAQKRDTGKYFVEFYNSHKEEMYLAAYRVLRNNADAQDAVQNGLLRLLENPDKLPKENEKAQAYAMVTIYRAAVDIYRKNRWHLRLRDNISEEIRKMGQKCGVDPFRYIFDMERSDELIGCLKRLHKDYCEIIMLYYYQELSLKEISEIYGMTEKAATTKLFRARKALKKELECDGLQTWEEYTRKKK